MKIIEISSKKFNIPSESERAKSKAMMDKMRKDGEKMIKGMFEFVDAQGGWLDFSYRFFPGEPVRMVKITHGEMVTIPMILAKHLNNVYKKVRQVADNLDTGKGTVTKISRTRFTPMEYLTEDFDVRAS